MRDEKNAGTGRLTWVEMVGGPLDGHKRQVDEARDPGRNIRFNELDRARAAVYRLRPGTRFYDYQGYEPRTAEGLAKPRTPDPRGDEPGERFCPRCGWLMRKDGACTNSECEGWQGDEPPVHGCS